MTRVPRLMAAAIVACVGLLAGTSALPLGLARAADDGATVIERYQAQVPQLMAEQGIPGLAVALVDKDKVLWTAAFGHVDRDGSAPVTVDTIFSVQSMSKNFTATAVMQAVQAGRLDLDAPITTYLPDFTVHSAFEQNPERKITLRMLLGHTAGFTHEAPIGNNYELDPGTFAEHVRSISDTWLRFPVGRGYAYSNLGIDLAGYILERTYGAPFATVMRDRLLGPLGMNRSTFDRTEIEAATDRAVGHSWPAPWMPPYDGMTAAGGAYSSAADLARYLRFQLNDGSIDGQTVLDPALMTEMRTIPEPHAGAQAGYALGVVRYRWRASANADLFSHGGGGFGFLSDLWWSPPLQVGVAVLTNSADHDLQADLALSILGDLVHEPGSVYYERLLSLPVQAPATDPDGGYLPPDGMADLVAGAGMRPLGDESVRWAGYVGAYRERNMGALDPLSPPGRFLVESGVPYYDAIDHRANGATVRNRLTEVEPGVFLAGNGETLDLRGAAPTWRNIDLVRITGGPASWQWGMLGAAGLASVWWLVAGLVAVVKRPRRKAASAARAVYAARQVLTAIAATLTAVFALGTIAVLVAVPGLVDSGFLGWLDLSMAQRLSLHLPLALAVAAGCLIVLLTVGRLGDVPRLGTLHRRYVALAVASAALTAQLAAWHLIGWGWSLT